MKKCNKCDTLKELEDFYKDSSKKDGFRTICKKCVLKNNRIYKSNESVKIKEKEWSTKNRSLLSLKYKERYQSDIAFRISKNLRNRLCLALQRNYKSGSAVSDLGCSIDDLKKYLESKFIDGMSWDNYGRNGWHIDHIKPLINFDLTNKEELIKACHYSNLQPLWARDNISKGAK